jgi:heavy metal sensor kinase
MFTSIKEKIIVYYLMILFVTLSGLGGLLYYSLGKIVTDAVDANLLAKARALIVLTSADREDRAEFRSSDEFTWEYGSPKAKSFFQIRGRGGFTLEKSASLKDAELPYSGKPDRTVFRTISLNGAPLRLVVFPVPVEREAPQEAFAIQCAEDIRGQRDILERSRLVLFIAVIAVMIASTLGGVVISRKALAPVEDISGTIDSISESNLSERIDVEQVPKELRILASSFNSTVDRLENAFCRQNQFAADASHELRTPLSVILSQSEIALRKERTAKEYRNALTEVLETAKRMSATVRKLLALNRLSADKGALNLESLDLGAIIDESVRQLRPLAENKKIRLQLPGTADPLPVRGDRTALLELFTNLLDNAIKYNVPGGEVRISVKKENGVVLCEIEDTGIGIPDGDREKVFDRFYRVDRSRSKEVEGSGLGLSICREIVRLHGGGLELRSGQGDGTSVLVRLRAGEV